jgi:hypothetical protein
MSAEDDMMFMMGSPFGDVSYMGSSSLGSFGNLDCVMFSTPPRPRPPSCRCLTNLLEGDSLISIICYIQRRR